MTPTNSRPLLLRGKIVQPDGSAVDRYLLVRDGVIRAISRQRPPLTDDVMLVETGPNDWIFPGLLDLHTHASYNILPIWDSPKAPFANRFEWRADAGYKADIGGNLKKLKGHTKARKVFSELQAIAGGTTLLDQQYPLDSDEDTQRTLLTRDTGSAKDLGLDPAKIIRSVVDFFEPRNGRPEAKRGWGGQPAPIEQYLAERDGGQLAGTLVHVAEGRSGFGSNRGVDPYTRAEFEALMAHPSMRDAAKVRSVPLTIVHGCGIDVQSEKHLKFLTDRNISVIWSPVSNLLLYGDTLHAEALIQAGVNVALGSDWSPSGSKHVWDEAKLARFFFDAIGSNIGDAEIFKMVTANAARCLNLPNHGRIQEGADADLFILRSPIESDSALEVFFSTTDRDVVATIVGGLPIYGDGTFLKGFGLELQNLPRREGSAVKNKKVHLPASCHIDLQAEVDAVEEQMKALEPAVFRSNLLVSSDKLYQRRVQFLRSSTEKFGWSVRQWLKKGPVTPGEVRVPPNAVRVWSGVMIGSDRKKFLQSLGEIFIPATAQMMKNVGLTAYFPAIPPDDKPEGCPDEVAVVFYESQKAYNDGSKKTVGGRAYGLLHSAVFKWGPTGSFTGFPVPFQGSAEDRRAYYLFEDEVDWYQGFTRVHIGTPKPGQSATEFREAVAGVCKSLQSRRPANLNGALLTMTNSHSVFWDHRSEDRDDDAAHLDALDAACHRVMRQDAEEVNCKADLYENWSGVDAAGGKCMKVVFERRGLRPY